MIGDDDIEHPLATALDDRIRAGTLELPLLPAVAVQIIAMGESDLRALTDLIHRDPALAGHVLRVVNSPAFMARNPITTLPQAVTRMGFTRLREMALALSLGTRVFSVSGYENEARVQWKHALLTAAFSKETARICGRDPEAAFLCGLLHDIGESVLLQALVDLAGGARLAPGWQDLIHARHTLAGAFLAAQWSLPTAVCEAIEYHHVPAQAPCDPIGAAVVAMGDRIAQLEDDVRTETFEPELRGLLNLPVIELGQLLARREQITKQAVVL